MCICDIWKNAQISYRKGVNSSAAASTAVSTRSSWKKAAPAPQHLPWLEPHNYLSKRGETWRMWHLIIRDVEVLLTFSINYQVKQHLSTHPTPPLCRYSWWSTVNILNIQIESNIVDVKKTQEPLSSAAVPIHSPEQNSLKQQPTTPTAYLQRYESPSRSNQYRCSATLQRSRGLHAKDPSTPAPPTLASWSYGTNGDGCCKLEHLTFRCSISF